MVVVVVFVIQVDVPEPRRKLVLRLDHRRRSLALLRKSVLLVEARRTRSPLLHPTGCVELEDQIDQTPRQVYLHLLDRTPHPLHEVRAAVLKFPRET